MGEKAKEKQDCGPCSSFVVCHAGLATPAGEHSRCRAVTGAAVTWEKVCVRRSPGGRQTVAWLRSDASVRERAAGGKVVA